MANITNNMSLGGTGPGVPLSLQEVMHKHNAKLLTIYNRIFPAEGSQAGVDWMDRRGLSNYSEIVQIAKTQYLPLDDEFEGTDYEAFYKESVSLLQKEMTRLSAKYKDSTEELTNDYALMLALFGNDQLSKEEIQTSAGDIDGRLKTMLESDTDGLYRDLKQIQALIETLEPRDKLLEHAKQQLSDDDCMVVEYPNVFKPSKPIVVKKNSLGWKKECQKIEDFYNQYSHFLYMHLHYLRRKISIIHDLREKLKAFKSDCSVATPTPPAINLPAFPETDDFPVIYAMNPGERIDKLFSQAFYSSPEGSEKVEWTKRKGISSYEEITEFAKIQLPKLEGFEKTTAGQFCKNAIERLEVQLADWDEKSDDYVDDLTRIFGQAGEVLQAETSKQQANGLQKLEADLDKMLNREDGIEADLHTVEKAYDAICPLDSYLQRARKQMKNQYSTTIEFPNFLDPEFPPIAINKSSPIWKQECALIEAFYEDYAEVLKRTAIHFTEIIGQCHKLRKELAGIRQELAQSP